MYSVLGTACLLMLFQNLTPQPDYLYDALFDLYKNGLTPTSQRTLVQHEAQRKKVITVYKAYFHTVITKRIGGLPVFFPNAASHLDSGMKRSLGIL